MSTETANRDQSSEQEQGFCTVDHVSLQIKALEKFVARRFDEISMEINATAQQMDMNDSDASKLFSQVLDTLNVISYSGAGDTAANSGVELEAVIDQTKDAVNKILDAAERISGILDREDAWISPEERARQKQSIREEIEGIYMACTFQDLAGQRIRNTLNSLHEMEHNLESTIESLGIKVLSDEKVIQIKTQSASRQDEIDALFG